MQPAGQECFDENNHACIRTTWRGWCGFGVYTHEDTQQKASVLKQRLSYPTETVLSNKIARNRIVLSFKDSPRKPLGRRPKVSRNLTATLPKHSLTALPPRPHVGSPSQYRRCLFHSRRPHGMQSAERTKSGAAASDWRNLTLLRLIRRRDEQNHGFLGCASSIHYREKSAEYCNIGRVIVILPAMQSAPKKSCPRKREARPPLHAISFSNWNCPLMKISHRPSLTPCSFASKVSVLIVGLWS